ncbi:hypothetical protein DFH29DRAFT_1071924 [Suillus ampliporus]|nr:hypothetical protein DFH29DRAFT_1071924 [Suillus ampliporus]
MIILFQSFLVNCYVGTPYMGKKVGNRYLPVVSLAMTILYTRSNQAVAEWSDRDLSNPDVVKLGLFYIVRVIRRDPSTQEDFQKVVLAGVLEHLPQTSRFLFTHSSLELLAPPQELVGSARICNNADCLQPPITQAPFYFSPDFKFEVGDVLIDFGVPTLYGLVALSASGASCIEWLTEESSESRSDATHTPGRIQSFYTTYKTFFSKVIEEKGVSTTLEVCIFCKKYKFVEGRDASAQPVTLARFLVGYGAKFGIPGMVVEDLALANVHEREFLLSYLSSLAARLQCRQQLGLSRFFSIQRHLLHPSQPEQSRPLDEWATLNAVACGVQKYYFLGHLRVYYPSDIDDNMGSFLVDCVGVLRQNAERRSSRSDELLLKRGGTEQSDDEPEDIDGFLQVFTTKKSWVKLTELSNPSQ